MQTKIISLRISPEFDRQIRIEAAKRDLNRSAFIRKTLDEKLTKILSTKRMSLSAPHQRIKTDLK